MNQKEELPSNLFSFPKQRVKDSLRYSHLFNTVVKDITLLYITQEKY